MRNRNLVESLRNALSGLLWVVGAERNATLLFLAAILALAGALAVCLEGFALALLILVITLVLATELFNTALERLLDLLYSEYHPQVQRIKDLAAGAVLLSALGAFVVGSLLLADRLAGVGEPLMRRLLTGSSIILLGVLVLLGRMRRR